LALNKPENNRMSVSIINHPHLIEIHSAILSKTRQYSQVIVLKNKEAEL